MKTRPRDIQLVITAALKKEIPVDWLAARSIPVLTTAALKSGALNRPDLPDTGMMVVITGVGPAASRDAACWIRDNLSPLFVLNIGTCGIMDRRRSTGRWMQPRSVSNEDGYRLEMDMRLPVPYPEGVKPVSSLLSVRKTARDGRPDTLKGHDIVDMEAYAQADVFRKTDITFHCLKFGTDHADADTISDFNKSIIKFRDSVRGILRFLEEDRTRVSAIIPVYNRERTIRRAIDSVLAQSYPPAEIIVVDDCSTDSTPDILASYGSRIRYIRLAKNSGPSAARNTGIRAAESGWVAFLDSDDCWERHKLRRQVEFIRKYPFYRIFQSDEKWIRNGRRVNPRRHHLKPEGWIWEKSLHRCLVSPSAVIARRSLLIDFGGFDENMPACEDYDLWLRISRRHPVGLESSKSVVKYGGHEDQLSRRIEALDRFRVISLLRILESEPESEFREKISGVLTEKFRILADGCRKRGKMLRLDLHTYKISLC